jgi:hypothetical protein
MQLGPWKLSANPATPWPWVGMLLVFLGLACSTNTEPRLGPGLLEALCPPLS